jgi:hypothetical protein
MKCTKENWKKTQRACVRCYRAQDKINVSLCDHGSITWDYEPGTSPWKWPVLFYDRSLTCGQLWPISKCPANSGGRKLLRSPHSKGSKRTKDGGWQNASRRRILTMYRFRTNRSGANKNWIYERLNHEWE